jgi:hypothetical protein
MANPETSLQRSGWMKIELQPSLRAAIEHLFFDICSYVLLLVRDSGVAIGAGRVQAFADAVAERDVAASERALQEVLLETCRVDRKLLGKLYDIGTRPMKFLSGMALFDDPQIRAIVDGFFAGASTPLLVRPYNGETLHFFPPGAENHKYNLPIHQDFPYLLQSPRQLTFWLNLTENSGRDAGRIRIYPDTHHLGVPKTRKNPVGHYEVATEFYPAVDLDRHVDSESSLFEMYAVDSLTWHSSIPNTSADSSRITYIFRISDIGCDLRVPFGVDRSVTGSQAFEDLYPELYLPT